MRYIEQYNDAESHKCGMYKLVALRFACLDKLVGPLATFIPRHRKYVPGCRCNLTVAVRIEESNDLAWCDAS